MNQQRDDGETVCCGGASETWSALCDGQARMSHLWATLFQELATAAAVPVPKMLGGSIAAYAEKKDADALATHARKILGDRVLRFDMKKSPTRPRHCVSVDL